MTNLLTLKNLLRFNNSFQIMMNRVFFGDTGPTIYRHGTLQFLVDHRAGDQDGPRSCVEPGLYDPFFDVIDWSGPITFLDLGANAGGFVLGLLKHGHEISRGIAVELNPLTWSRLIYNLYSNVPLASEKITVINGAVAGADGFLDIRLGAGSVGDSTAGCESGSLYHLKCHTLPELISHFEDKSIHILKIDIEGSEYDLLKTPADCLRNVQYLMIEIHEVLGREESEVHDWVRNCGFAPIAPAWKPIESNVFLFSNNRSALSQAVI